MAVSDSSEGPTVQQKVNVMDNYSPKGYEELQGSGGDEDHTPDSYSESRPSILDAATRHHDDKFSDTRIGNNQIRTRGIEQGAANQRAGRND